MTIRWFEEAGGTHPGNCVCQSCLLKQMPPVPEALTVHSGKCQCSMCRIEPVIWGHEKRCQCPRCAEHRAALLGKFYAVQPAIEVTAIGDRERSFVAGPPVTATQPPHLLQEDCPCTIRGSQSYWEHGRNCPWREALREKFLEDRLRQRIARNKKTLILPPAAHPSLAARIAPEGDDWAALPPEPPPPDPVQEIRQALAAFDDWYARRGWIPPATGIPEGGCANCRGPKGGEALLCRYCRELGSQEKPREERHLAPRLVMISTGMALMIAGAHWCLPVSVIGLLVLVLAAAVVKW